VQRAATSAALGPKADTATGGGFSGTEYNRAFSTV
jgi:hypothetical protein